MPYIKPNGYDVYYPVTLYPTHTQKGYKAIRFIGDEISDRYNNGFKYYDDNNVLIYDLSNYKYFYSTNVYSVQEDEIVNPKPNNAGAGVGSPSGDPLVGMVMKLNEKVNNMETYIETKPAFIGDTECIFNIEKTGAVQAQLTVDGVITPCQYTVDNNVITVTFDALEEVGEVTVFIIQ